MSSEIQKLEKGPEITICDIICMGNSNPFNSFSSFDSQQLSNLVEFYPNEFPRRELSRFSDQIDNYIQGFQ